jgi:2-oxoglutarate ferredoxin oxidoreductase subunit alpha
MQLTGGRFTSETALTGNDLATYPDFPAEIRAPAGSLPGVSGFQLHFADHDILTPGDRPDVLVAMNPAALKTNLADLPKGGTLIVDTDAFTDRNLKKAGYDSNPIEDGSLADYQVHAVQLTAMTVGALKEIEGVTAREEHVRARSDVVALRSPHRVDDDVYREEVRQAAGDRGGEPEGVQHGVRIRRDVRGVRGSI